MARALVFIYQLGEACGALKVTLGFMSNPTSPTQKIHPGMTTGRRTGTVSSFQCIATHKQICKHTHTQKHTLVYSHTLTHGLVHKMQINTKKISKDQVWFP